MNSAILGFTQNKSRLFLIFIALFVISCIFFVPFLGLLFLGLFLNEKLKSKTLKLAILALGFVTSVVLNVFSILSFFQQGPEVINNLFFGYLFWYSEFFHFTSLIFFVYAFYRIFRYSNTPYSYFYLGTHQFIHAIYKGCPITQLQNYLTMGMTSRSPVPNTYWMGLFGEYSEYFRMGFLTLSMVFLYRAYLEYTQLDIPLKDWLSLWKEGKYQNSPAVARYDTKQAH